MSRSVRLLETLTVSLKTIAGKKSCFEMDQAIDWVVWVKEGNQLIIELRNNPQSPPDSNHLLNSKFFAHRLLVLQASSQAFLNSGGSLTSTCWPTTGLHGASGMHIRVSVYVMYII